MPTDEPPDKPSVQPSRFRRQLPIDPRENVFQPLQIHVTPGVIGAPSAPREPIDPREIDLYVARDTLLEDAEQAALAALRCVLAILFAKDRPDILDLAKDLQVEHVARLSSIADRLRATLEELDQRGRL